MQLNNFIREIIFRRHNFFYLLPISDSFIFEFTAMYCSHLLSSDIDLRHRVKYYKAKYVIGGKVKINGSSSRFLLLNIFEILLTLNKIGALFC